jgi:hypothetical protein
MTKEEIVLALRACGNEESCLHCPYFNIAAWKFRCNEKDTEAADLIEAQAAEIEKLKAQVPRRIPVEERLPEQDVPVLAWFEDGLISRQSPDIVLWNGHEWMHRHLHRNVCGITHWMPLPGVDA